MNRGKLRAVYEKTKGRCWYCGSYMYPLGNWQVEHQNPRAQGGDDHHENLVPACRECNTRKGNRTVEQYRRSLLVKLEHAITTAYELADEIEGYVGWEHDDINGYYPPDYLNGVTSQLGNVASTVVNLRLIFHGERCWDTELVPPVSEGTTETEAVQ